MTGEDAILSDSGRAFHLGEDFFRRLRRNYLMFGAATLALVCVITLLPALHGPGQTLTSALMMAGFLCVITLVAMVRGYRKTVARYRGFRIVLFPQGLKRTLPGQEDLYIAAGEVSRVLSRPGSGCGVEGVAGQQAIWIPARLPGYEELMRTVETWRTPEIRTGYWSTARAQWLTTAAFLGALAVVILTEDKILVTAVGMPFVAYLGWSAMDLRRSAYANAQQKRGAGTLWFVMALFTWKIAHVWLA